jgi:hypothetical protein
MLSHVIVHSRQGLLSPLNMNRLLSLSVHTVRAPRTPLDAKSFACWSLPFTSATECGCGRRWRLSGRRLYRAVSPAAPFTSSASGGMVVGCGQDSIDEIIQYADDTILILEACPRQLFFLKAMLNSFADSTWLHVNYNKSNIYSINVSEQKIALLANTFHCKVGALPFTYLGLPLGLKKPNLEAFLPLIQKIERRLASTSIFLSQADRLQMVNAVFSSLPTYYMCTLKLPKTVIKQIDKLRRHCLRRGADINAKKPPQVDWKSVCRPKTQGGLGVINLEWQNKALLMKCLHKFFNRVNIPWVNIIWDTHYNNSLPSTKPVGSFWWKDILKIQDSFKEIAQVQIGNGKSTLLWHDRWNGQCLSQKFPELWSFASVKEINIHQA